MSRMTVRLPASLHQQLERLAHDEGVSMNQYVVYALTRQTGILYDLVATTPTERRAERQRWEELRQRLGTPASAEAVRTALMSREPVEPEPDLSPAARELMHRLENGQSTNAAS
ncbi:MAG: toxin-antitoxin system HicB family antitoxin [Phycisphaerales bacterium]|nr:toxin-antitoxin system HicB family antitoxin [Phycisphaerales bacterium]